MQEAELANALNAELSKDFPNSGLKVAMERAARPEVPRQQVQEIAAPLVRASEALTRINRVAEAMEKAAAELERQLMRIRT